MNLLLRPVRSSLGSKYVMAVTGAVLLLFVIGHMAGNLQIFLGKQALNDYAHHLEELPSLLWTVRVVLLMVFLLHIAMGIRLWILNRRARPVGYYMYDTVQASWASRHMLLTGLVILLFVIYHLLHFTFGVTDPEHFKRNPAVPMYHAADSAQQPEYDVAAMVVGGFDRDHWYVSVAYMAAQILLGVHLWHGAGSWLQSLGLNNRRWQRVVHGAGGAIALLIVAGNCSIPLAILTGWRPT
jgi:succinate dehydrogenase / fumarate reductase, cytochrome b subunit